jgi:nitrogen-specific signal transduction histidine kinase
MGFATSGSIPPAFLCFALLFPHAERSLHSRNLALLFLPAFFSFALLPTRSVIASLGTGAHMFSYGPLHRVFSLYLISYIVAGFCFLLSTYWKSAGIARLQIKYCFLGMILTASLSVTTNLILPTAGVSKFNWLGPFFTVFYVGFVTYSIVKHRLLDTTIVLKRGTTYAYLVLLLFFPSGMMILLGQKVFFGHVNYPFSALTVAILFLVTIFFHGMKPQAERSIEQFLFKKRYGYREPLGELSKVMVSILDLESLSSKIIDTITRAMRVERASLFLFNDEKGDYELRESRNLAQVRYPPTVPRESALPRWLLENGELIIREELAKQSGVPEAREVVSAMADLEAEVSLPLICKEQLIGMINLSHKFDTEVYSSEDIELLATLANQAAISLENARLYEDLKKSKSYIRRADRLASLGTLTAGLAHEIRNPLVAIKTLIQLLPERMEDEEFRSHFLQIASDEVDRISSLVNELLEFARPSEPNFGLEDINTILDGMLLLVSTESKKKHIELIKECAGDLPRITVDGEQIKQVFLNVLLNAIEATPEGGEIVVKTRSFLKPGGDPFVQVEFTDTGCGIAPESLEDIFTPFFTTKTQGSGLGLSISNQIIQDHKGYINVRSEIEKGSTFFINLPVRPEHPKRRRSDVIGESDDRFETS